MYGPLTPCRVGVSSGENPGESGEWTYDGEGTLRTRGLYGV